MYSTDIIENMPEHIAIIIDGNGRWAQKCGQARSYGHRIGAKNLHTVVELSIRLEIVRASK
jgi:undecaprenyl diphosphate synthase